MIGQIILNHGLNVAKPLAEPSILGFRTFGQLVRASPVDTKNLGGFGQNGLFRYVLLGNNADVCRFLPRDGNGVKILDPKKERGKASAANLTWGWLRTPQKLGWLAKVKWN